MCQKIGFEVIILKRLRISGILLGDLKEVNDDSIIVAYKEKTRNKTIEIDRNNINVIMTAVKL